MIDFLSLNSVTNLHSAEIHEAVRRVIDSGWYLQGQENEQFEREYADYIGTKYCVGCANGLDALIWILRAYKELGYFRDGDEVLVPANTYIATILAITENNLKAVLVEPRLDTLEIDDSILEAHLTDRTKAVMIVHLYGRCAYTEKIAAFCKNHNLKLFEDNAQAHGCKCEVGIRNEELGMVEKSSTHHSSLITHHSRRTGALGDAAGHSFYPGKNLGALGDAGCVTTDDKDVADCIRSLGNYGSSKKYVFQYCGRNSRLDEIQAAVLRVKLRHLDETVERRRDVADMYYEGIEVEKIGGGGQRSVSLPLRMPREQNAYHLFPIMCKNRDALQAHLKEKGVQTLIHYPIAPHQQECYKKAIADGLLVLPEGGLSITEQIHAQELSLPIGPTITDDEVQAVVSAVNSFSC